MNKSKSDNYILDMYEKLISDDSKDNDIKRENANIDGDTTMGIMLKLGSESSKYFYNERMIPERYANAHKEGRIHIHDLDFYGLTTTCCQLDLTKLFKDGFYTGNGYIREPNDIRTYSALACIAIQCNQNEQYGGQAVPKFDYDIAPGVAKTFIKEICRLLDYENNLIVSLDFVKTRLKELYATEKTLLSEKVRNIIINDILSFMDTVYINPTKTKIYDKALEYTEIATLQAMEGLIHNLNTMHSRAGAQVPFSSLNYGTDTSEEGRMVTRCLLQATLNGMGNGETPIFPVQIFKVKDGVTANPEDPNYDLFKFACEVSAKRLFPNFSFLDSDFNKAFYKEGRPETEVGYMGCSVGSETLTIKDKTGIKVISIGELYNTYKGIEQTYGVSKYYDTIYDSLSVFDSKVNDFVQVKKLIKNPNKNNWKRINTGKRFITLTDDHPLDVKGKGRTHVKDLKVGDELVVSNMLNNTGIDDFTNTVFTDNTNTTAEERAYLLGIILCDGSLQNQIIISLGMDEYSCIDKIKSIFERLGGKVVVTEQNRGVKGKYYDVYLRHSNTKTIIENIKVLFRGVNKIDRRVPLNILESRRSIICSFVSGMVDADGYLAKRKGKYYYDIGSTNRELALGQFNILSYLGANPSMGINWYKGKAYPDKIRTRISFTPIQEISESCILAKKKPQEDNSLGQLSTYTHTKIKSITPITLDEDSYDLETETDTFDLSGIHSHNCRTRVAANIFNPDNEVITGRGNLSFTSINLPYLALSTLNLSGFYKELRETVNLVFDQLLERLRVQGSRKVKNYPFMMGQGIWIDSDKLGDEDTVLEVLKNGTLAVGFIGLAETLVALCGKHHGESEYSQGLGLEIISFMRKLCDKKAKETGLNFSLIATPAEGLSSRFTKIDIERFGEIKGVTDREYYTNSFHVPVYYKINAFKKIEIEAPYHKLTNGGHISYVEMDGDPSKNIESFMQIIKAMKDENIGYGAINHPVDRCPVCGYIGVIDDVCPGCGRHEGEEICISCLPEYRRKQLIKN